MTQAFKDALAAGDCFLFDGSTPTVLYERGVFINRSFEECNLSSPDLVRTVHEEFHGAGAQVISTNTWAANRVKLQSYGLTECLEDINTQGAQLARKALGSEGWVAGTIGPLGLRIEPWGPTSFEEAKAAFAEQARALLAGSVDLFVLESFADLNEIHQAILAIQSVCHLPIAAMMTPNDEGETLFGTAPEWYIRKLSEWGADLVGVNGGTGPARLLELLKHFKAATSTPIVLQPSAGLPREVDGRLLYMASPEYLGEFARQALLLGARAVGGESGTTPAHIRAMRGAFRQSHAFSHSGMEQTIREVAPTPVVVPRPAPSHWARKLDGKQFAVCVELVPPKGIDLDALLARAHRCRDMGADAINIPDGPRAMARMSALATACIIHQRVGIEPILHYACRDRNLLGMQGDLLGAAGMGIRNILAITGDPPKMGSYPHSTAVFDVDAIGLVNMLSRLNDGQDLGGSAIGTPTAFSLGVGANPCAPDQDREQSRFRWKVDAGAQWAITQPVFDAESFFRFLDFAEPLGIPVIAGIWPLRSLRNAEFMANEVPGVLVPPSVLQRMATWPGAEDQQKEGLAIAMEIVERILPRIHGLQVAAPLGQVDILSGILKHVGCVPRNALNECVGGA